MNAGNSLLNGRRPCPAASRFAQEATPKSSPISGANRPNRSAERLSAFVQGLAETGQVEGAT